MKKYFISGVMALAISAVFTGCSKSNDLYDEGAVQQSKQNQKIAEYNAAFEKAFGKVAVGNDWGFGNVSVTRAAVIRNFDQYDPAGLAEPINAQKEVEKFIKKFNDAPVATDLDLSGGEYFLQHVIKQTSKGNITWGTNDQHHQMAQLQAFNYITGNWEDVTGFEKGKNVNQYVDNKKAHKGTTLMTNMGAPDGRPQFQWIAKKNATVGEGYECNNYVIKKIGNQYFLGLGYINKPEDATNSATAAYNQYDAWIIRIVKAEGDPGYTQYGRVMCEDLGSTQESDLDFNDVVFDAYIMNDGSINITVLAAGGVLRPLYVGKVAVTLPTMCNTGTGVTADPQSFTIPASVAKENKWFTLADIPVEVPGADGNLITLESKSDGSAPAKVCTYVGVPWAKERTKLDTAYLNWTTYVTTTNPQIWYGNQVEGTTYPQFFEETEIGGE